MEYRLETSAVAANQISDAYLYYERIRFGLGDRFLTALFERYNDISIHPEYFGFVDANNVIRDVKINKFPYTIVYEVQADAIVIYAVYHNNRHSDNRFKL